MLALEEGHLLPDADVEQILFELHGLILSLHHDARFLRNPGALARAGQGFERMLNQYAPPGGPPGGPQGAAKPAAARR